MRRRVMEQRTNNARTTREQRTNYARTTRELRANYERELTRELRDAPLCYKVTKYTGDYDYAYWGCYLAELDMQCAVGSSS